MVSVIAADNIVTRIDMHTHWLFQGVVYVGNELRDWPVVYTPGHAYAVIPEANTSSVEVGVFRMRHGQHISAVPSTTSYATIPLATLPDVTILYSVYGNEYVFFGPPPREFLPHLLHRGCVNVADDSMQTHFRTANGNQTAVKIDRFATHHVVTGAAVCGPLVRKDLTLDVDCTHATHGSETVLSAPLLELGVHLQQDAKTRTACFYTPNHYEVDHTFAWTVIWTIVGLTATWLQMTKHLAITASPDAILSAISVTYSVMSYDIVLGVWNTNVFSAIQHSHTLYGFAVLRMAPRSVVDVTVAVFAYVVCSVGACLALLAITIGAVLQTHRPFNAEYKIGTWGLQSLANRPTYQRLGIVCIAVTVAVAFVSSIWQFVLKDTGGLIVSTLSTIATVLHASTPEFASNWVAKRSRLFQKYDLVLAVYSRWAVEFLLTTCLILNLPHDLSGHRSSPFRIIVSLGVSTAILVVTARDFAILYCLLKGNLWRHWLHPVAAFIVWFAALFGVGPFFSQTDALANKEMLSIYPALSSCALIFVPVYVITTAKVKAAMQ